MRVSAALTKYSYIFPYDMPMCALVHVNDGNLSVAIVWSEDFGFC